MKRSLSRSLILACLLAGVPLTILRRRQARAGVADEEEDEDRAQRGKIRVDVGDKSVLHQA